MAHPGAVQICWLPWPEANGIKDPQPTVYPFAKVPNGDNIYAGYLIFLSKKFSWQKHYLIVGAENCREQLKVWNIKEADLGVEGLLE